MPIKLTTNNGNIDLKVPIKQLGGGAVDSVNGMTGDVVLEIPSKTSDLTNDSGFLTQIPDEYVTETELDAKGYLTEHQSLEDYALKTDIPDVSGFALKSEIPSIEGLASTEYVDNAIANIPAPDLSKCVQIDKENIFGDNGSIISNSIRGNSLTISNGTIEQKNGNQDSVALGNAKVVFSHDVDGSSSTRGNGTFTMYGRKGEEYFKFKGTNGDVRVSGIATPTLSNDAVNKGYVDSQIATIEIPTVPTNVSAFTNDAGYLTAVPSEYVTETELNAKGYLTEHQSLADYSTTTQVQSMINTAIAGITDGEAVNY